MTAARRKTVTVSLRIEPALKREVEEAAAAHPYRPSLTAIIERGLRLALDELKAGNPT